VLRMKYKNTIYLFLFSFQLSAFIPSPSALAQAPGYSREEVAAHENAQPEGITQNASTATSTARNMVGSNLSIPGGQTIGAQRASTGGGIRSGVATLRYDLHRDIQPPQYATFRIGPLYSDIGLSQSVGYRYVRLDGGGVDYLINNRRGEIKDDGSEFPLISSLSLNNYLIITRHMDLEANVRVTYEHYPLDTQEDELRIDLSDGGEVFGTFSSEFHPTRDTRLLIYDEIIYETDYLDSRGTSDRYGGTAYESLKNTIGADWDWKPSPFDNLALSVSRKDTIPLGNAFTNQESVVYAEAVSYQRDLTRFSSAGLLGSFSQSLYDLESRSDIYMSGISAFAAAQLARRLTGNVSLGYQTSSSRGGISDGNRSGSVFGGGGVEHDISETKRQKLTYLRTQAEAFNGGVDVNDQTEYEFVWSGGLFPGTFSTTFASSKPQDENRNGYSDWTTGLSLRHQLTRLLELSLSTRYAIRKNDTSSTAATDTTTPDLNSDYETLSVRLGMGMRLTQKMQFSTYVEHADRTSDNENLAYTRDVFAATITWSHKF